MEEQRIKPFDIVEQTFQCVLNIVRFCNECERRNSSARTLKRQLLKPWTSVGANIEEAQSGQSRADFISKNVA